VENGYVERRGPREGQVMTGGSNAPKKRIKTEVSELSQEENQRLSEERRRWFKEGRCPWCGELGAFVAGAPVCSVHGPYDFVPEVKEDEGGGLDEAELLPEEDEEEG
jgi:hypothetical protein